MFFGSDKPDAFDAKDVRAGGFRRQLTGEVKPYNKIQLHHLLRLARLLTLHREQGNVLPANDWRSKLLNKATYSTYCDCVESGVGGDARALFQQERAVQQGHPERR